VCLCALLATGCGRIGFDATASEENGTEVTDVDAGDLIVPTDAGPVEPIQLSVDRVAPDAIYGTFSGLDPQLVGSVEVFDGASQLVRTLNEITTAGDRFAILLGDDLLAGLDVSFKLRDAAGMALFEMPALHLPDTADVSAVVPRGLHLSYFTNQFYIGLATAGTHCLDIVGEDGQIHTDGGCLQLEAVDNVLVDLSQLSGTIDINARYSLCEGGSSDVTACTSLIALKNHMAVEKLVLDTVNSLFSIVLGGNLSACIRIMDENQTQILLTYAASEHACVSTYISGYATQDIALSELTSPIDPLLKYSICTIDTRGLAYSVCTPLAMLEMP
jgi:hypothetical protein